MGFFISSVHSLNGYNRSIYYFISKEGTDMMSEEKFRSRKFTGYVKRAEM
jgi:hypothetical protein